MYAVFRKSCINIDDCGEPNMQCATVFLGPEVPNKEDRKQIKKIHNEHKKKICKDNEEWDDEYDDNVEPTLFLCFYRMVFLKIGTFETELESDEDNWDTIDTFLKNTKKFKDEN